MKLPVVLLAGSLVANAALAVVVAMRPAVIPSAFGNFFAGSSSPGAHPATSESKARPPSEHTQSRAIARALPRFWSTLQSDDLPALVANLRAAGFSPALIRAIVESRLNTRFAARMKEFNGTLAEKPFWKGDERSGVGMPRYFEDLNQIYRDRSKMMRELLGDDFFALAGTNPGATQRRMFGDLPGQKRELVQRIADDYAELNAQVRASTQGVTLPEDREKFALLEREKRADLAALLSPEELQAYEMRTSQVTMRLRSAFTWMDATEDEFRAIYRAQQAHAAVLFPDYATEGISYMNAETMKQRREVQQQAANEIKAALGESRYADFARASSMEFQQLARLTQRENIPAETAVRAFSLRDGVAAESARIFNDSGQTTEQKRVALQALAENTKAQLISTLGTNVGNNYIRSARWLSSIAGGGTVTFAPDGSISNMRSLPRN